MKVYEKLASLIIAYKQYRDANTIYAKLCEDKINEIVQHSAPAGIGFDANPTLILHASDNASIFLRVPFRTESGWVYFLFEARLCLDGGFESIVKKWYSHCTEEDEMMNIMERVESGISQMLSEEV
jgi:hypothetical protein